MKSFALNYMMESMLFKHLSKIGQTCDKPYASSLLFISSYT